MPGAFRRLLTDEEITHFAADPRFVFLKDVSCNLETVKRRLELTKNSGLVVSNANAAIAFDAMKSGASGFVVSLIIFILIYIDGFKTKVSSTRSLRMNYLVF